MGRLDNMPPRLLVRSAGVERRIFQINAFFTTHLSNVKLITYEIFIKT